MQVFGIVGVLVGLLYVVVGCWGASGMAAIGGAVLLIAGCFLLAISHNWE